MHCPECNGFRATTIGDPEIDVAVLNGRLDSDITMAVYCDVCGRTLESADLKFREDMDHHHDDVDVETTIEDLGNDGRFWEIDVRYVCRCQRCLFVLVINTAQKGRVRKH